MSSPSARPSGCSRRSRPRAAAAAGPTRPSPRATTGTLKERGLEVGAEGEDAGEDVVGELDEDALVEALAGLGDGAGRAELAAELEERRVAVGAPAARRADRGEDVGRGRAAEDSREGLGVFAVVAAVSMARWADGNGTRLSKSRCNCCRCGIRENQLAMWMRSWIVFLLSPVTACVQDWRPNLQDGQTS